MKSTGAKVFLLMCVLFSATSLASLAAVEAVRIGPLPFSATTGVTVEARISEDRPDISLEYRWLINGEESIFERSAHLPGSQFKRGDVVKVEVTPVTYTGDRLPSIASRSFEATNALPVITSDPPEELTESGFRYQVTAVDPDGDAVTFKLEGAPEDMQINASSGLIQWKFDPMPEGTFPVKVIVDDGHGGQTDQSFELQLAYEEAQSP